MIENAPNGSVGEFVAIVNQPDEPKGRAAAPRAWGLTGRALRWRYCAPRGLARLVGCAHPGRVRHRTDPRFRYLARSLPRFRINGLRLLLEPSGRRRTPIQNDGESAALFCWAMFVLIFLGWGSWAVDRILARRREVNASEPTPATDPGSATLIEA